MPIAKKCDYCGDENFYKPYKVSINKRFFCSQKCKTEYQKGKPTWNKGKKLPPLSVEHRKKISDGCKTNPNIIRTQFKKGRTRTKEEIRKATKTLKERGSLSGERNGMFGRVKDRNPNWKGGVSYWRKEHFNSIKYKKWQKSVWERDGFKCQICGNGNGYKKKDRIHAHHIKSFAKHPSLRFNIDNGVTLCFKCHMKIHSKKFCLGVVKRNEVIKKTSKMYDIEVEDNHNFFVNGVLTHNSATPKREDGNDMKLTGALGDIVYKITTRELIEQGYLCDARVHWLQISQPPYIHDYQTAYKILIVENVERNTMICNKVRALQDKKILILVGQIEHGQKLLEMLDGENATFIYSKTKIMDLSKRIIIATSIFDEGFDLPAIDVIVMAGGGKSSIKTTQRIGRALRPHPDKTMALIIDIRDGGKHLYSHYQKRMEIYNEFGFSAV